MFKVKDNLLIFKLKASQLILKHYKFTKLFTTV